MRSKVESYSPNVTAFIDDINQLLKTPTPHEYVNLELYNRLLSLASEDETSFGAAVSAYKAIAATRVKNLIDGIGVQYAEAARMAGITHLTSLVHSTKPERGGLRLNIKELAGLCYNVFQMSLHEFFTAEEPSFAIDKTTSMAVRALTNHKTDARLKQILTELPKKLPTSALVSEPDDVFYHRIAGYCMDRGLSFDAVFQQSDDKRGRKNVISIGYASSCRAMVAAHEYGEDMSFKGEMAELPKNSMRLKFVLSTAAAFPGIPIDYFVVDDYTSHAQHLYYYEDVDDILPEGELIDIWVISKLRELLRATAEDRAKIFGMLAAEFGA